MKDYKIYNITISLPLISTDSEVRAKKDRNYEKLQFPTITSNIPSPLDSYEYLHKSYIARSNLQESLANAKVARDSLARQKRILT